jgi:hypothetical protein
MDRRKFLQSIAIASAAMNALPAIAKEGTESSGIDSLSLSAEETESEATQLDVEGHTLICTFKNGETDWKVYEDLRTREGVISLVASSHQGHVLAKSAEASYPDYPDATLAYLGLKLADIGMSGPDLLADRLLRDGDPDPQQVKAAAPPAGSAPPSNPYERPAWNTFVGTKECMDTMPVYPSGNTRTYHPGQYFPEINQAAAGKREEGLLGGWMPAVRKVFPVADGHSSNGHYEVIVFGDVAAHDRFIVQTWHRTAHIQDGKILKVQYGYSYPAFPPSREDPAPEEFYAALLEFTLYWKKQLRDLAPIALPDKSLADMSRYCFAKELMVRPGGVYPKYGAVDRDYYGSEYDGFQDIFTSALYTNLEWGRFEMAGLVLDNYYSDFVDAKGMINMRGPETAQFGLTLSLIARYFSYTQDKALMQKHRAKFEATATILTQLHDESLRIAKDDVSYGLIRGWSESDSCLAPKPMTWWLPYFANSAFASRGFKDLARAWKELGWEKPGTTSHTISEWLRRSEQLKESVAASMRKSVRRDMSPPYIGPVPGTKLTFRESLQTEHPSPQQWAHRPYAELLQADVLPSEIADTVIDCMRAYGATTLGVVANVERPHAGGRDILGFISYGYAQMLLRLDRIEEYLLFLYSHQYHDHTRGSWTAGEVSGITGDTALFCIPAQQTIPLLVRWMLVLEDSDEDRLHLGKGLPREWVTSGKEIRIEQAPTRWGRVNFRMISDGKGRVTATVELPGKSSLKELQVKLRLPKRHTLKRVTVNGNPAEVNGLHNDTVLIEARDQTRFEVVGEFA